MTGTLILLRHGQSQANADGLFTGLRDAMLTVHGCDEARRAAMLIERAGLHPAAWFCSPLQRALETAKIVKTVLTSPPDHIEVDWRLAERNYGALTGKRKTDILAEYGQEQFLTWRRSVHTAPPPLTHEQFLALGNLPEWLGLTESLADVIARVSTLWRERIEPTLHGGNDVLVIAHGNSLRALCTVLDHLDADAVAALNIPTGHPLVYRFDDDGHPLTRGGLYLDAAAAAIAADTIAREGGT
jgi:2,3-bisphosphoglycerate-dependent phosphoglycerate mutase